MRSARFILLSLMLLVFSGCTTANLWPRHVDGTDDAQMQGQLLLLQSMQRRDPNNHWASLKFMKVVAKDQWLSTRARLSTPMTQDVQQVQWAFNVATDGVFLKFLDGKKRGDVIGIEQGNVQDFGKGKRQQKFSQRGKTYLLSVKNYFFWPQMMHNFNHIVDLGEAEHDLRRYRKIFVADRADFASGTGQQYIVWVNRQNLYIEYIEFQVKELTGSYRGVVQYRNYRDINGILLPQEIILWDNMGTQTYSHKINVQIQTLE